ncbi:DUF4238 domain-containing protein [Pseudomonas spelaei]
MEEFNLKSLKNKKHQHYVPQFYLDYWVEPNGVDVKSKIEGSIPQYTKYTSVDVAAGNYFYKIEVDDVVWDMLSYRFLEESKTDVFIKKTMDGLHLLKITDDVATKGIGVVNPDEIALKNVRGILRHFNKHYLEDEYGKIEKVISAELNRFVESQKSESFVPPTAATFKNILVFYSFQLFRTRERMDAISSEISQMILSRGDSNIVLTLSQKETVMKCMLYIFSYQFAVLLGKVGCTVNILKNNTALNYITTDCPAVYFDKARHGLKESIGILPLSPKLLINLIIPGYDKKGPGRLEVRNETDEELVKKTNELIERHSHNFVYTKIL